MMDGDKVDNANADTTLSLEEVLKKLEEKDAQYKNLQRTYGTLKKQNKELAAQVAENSTNVYAALSRNEGMTAAIMEALANQQGFEKLKEVGVQITQKAVTDKALASFTGKMTNLLVEHEVDWDTEPRLEAARQALRAGNKDEAFALARASLESTSAKSEVDVEAIKAQAREEARKEFQKVDTGTSTAVAPRPKKLQDLLGKAGELKTQEERTAHRKALLEAIGQGG